MRLCSAILAAVVATVCTACILPVHGAARISMGEEGRYVNARRPHPKTYTKPSCGPTNQITQWGKLVNASVPILPEYPRYERVVVAVASPVRWGCQLPSCGLTASHVQTTDDAPCLVLG